MSDAMLPSLVSDLMSMVASINQVSLIDESTLSLPSSLPSSLPTSSFSAVLATYNASPPTDLVHPALLEAIWTAAGPSLIAAIADQQHTLTPSILACITTRADPTVPTVPTMMSEYTAALALLSSLARHLKPVDQHSLSLEFLSLTTPIYNNNPAKVSAGGILACFMMRDSLTNLLAAPTRPRLTISLVATTITTIFDSLYPDISIEDDVSEASGFGVDEETSEEIDDEEVYELFVDITTQTITISLEVLRSITATNATLDIAILKTHLHLLALLSHCVTRHSHHTTPLLCVASMTAILNHSPHLSADSTVLHHPQRLQAFINSGVSADSDSMADTSDDSSDDSSDDDAAGNPLPPPPPTVSAVLATLPFTVSPRMNTCGVSMLAAWYCLNEGGEDPPPPPAIIANSYLWECMWPHVGVLIAEGESKLEEEPEVERTPPTHGRELIDLGYALLQKLICAVPDGSITTSRTLTRTAIVNTVQLVLNCMVNFKEVKYRECVRGVFSKLDGEGRVGVMRRIIKDCPFPVVKGVVLGMVRKVGIDAKVREDVFGRYLNEELVQLWGSEGVAGVEVQKDIYVEAAVGYLEVVRAGGSKLKEETVGVIKELGAAARAEGNWSMNVLVDMLERVVEASTSTEPDA